MGISTLQLEHLMVGRKLDARVDAMIAFHFLSPKSRQGMFLFVYKHAALRFRAACLQILLKVPTLLYAFRGSMSDVEMQVVQGVQVILS